MPTSDSIAALLQRAVDQSILATEKGKLTVPRGWGVYELATAPGVGRRFRFGNHPVRYDELVREFGKVSVLGIFTSRADADALQKLKNAG